MKHISKFPDGMVAEMNVTSSAFKQDGAIPAKYSCDGKNVNPPLAILNIPEGTKSLAIIVDDPDAPVGTWVHWVVWNIETKAAIKENTVPGKQGMNDFGRHAYGGPCPPSGTHRYFFKVYALKEMLDLDEHTTKAILEKAMSPFIAGYGELMGLYTRK